MVTLLAPHRSGMRSSVEMTIILIRHGETDGNAQRVVQVPETPLNRRGIAQAGRVARRLEREGTRISLLCSSDLARAHMTAEPIAERLGLEIEPTADLQERNFGDLRGRSYDEIGFDIMADGFEPPAGESWEVFHRRVAGFWSRAWPRFLDAAEEGAVVLVTHGLVLRSLASQVMAIPQHEQPERWGNTCMTVFDSAPPHAVSLLACVAHLEGDSSDDDRAIAGI